MLTTIRKILALLNRKERWQFLTLIGAVLVMGLLQVASVASVVPFVSILSNPDSVHQSTVMRWLFNMTRFENFHAFLFLVGSLVLGIVVVSNAFTMATIWLMTHFARGTQHRLSTTLLQSYLNRPYVYYLRQNSTELGKNILAEVQLLSSGILSPALDLIGYGVSALFVLGFLMWMDPLTGPLVVGVIGGGYALVYAVARRILSAAGQRRMDANRDRYKIVNEAFAAIKDVKLLGRETSFVARFIEPSGLFARANMTRDVVMQLPHHGLEVVAFGGLLSIVLFLIAMKGGIQEFIPLFAAYAFGAYRIMPALQRLFQGVSQVRFNQVVVDTIYLDMMEDCYLTDGLPKRSDGRRERLPFQHSIRLENVTFTYPDSTEPSIQDLNLTILRGSSLGIVGRTGAGKTTLLDILIGLLEPQKGHLVIDGVVLEKPSLRSWQNMIGYVPQHIHLCDDTVARNIAFGIPPDEIIMESVERAARIANLHDFVTKELPDGYDTVVGERGIRLSGGQRQRVGIARALYHDPEVLVLDEATSALDGSTEEAVQQAIAHLAGRKTVIIVAHRLTTIRDCDAVYLMEGGRFVAEGTYDGLMRTNALFRSMARVQGR